MYFSFLYFYFQKVELCQICGLKPVMDWPSSKVYYKWFGEWMGKCDLNYCSINNTFYFNSFYDPDNFFTITILLSRIQI